jgi:hypothetical protein
MAQPSGYGLGGPPDIHAENAAPFSSHSESNTAIPSTSHDSADRNDERVVGMVTRWLTLEATGTQQAPRSGNLLQFVRVGRLVKAHRVESGVDRH